MLSTTVIGAGLVSGYYGYASAHIVDPNHIGAANVNVAAACGEADETHANAARALCDSKISQLKQIVLGNEDTNTAKYFNIFNKTVGINCDNFLEWNDKFHLGGTGYIDGIRPEDLSKSAMWGIDRAKRPYIALKYTCDQTDSKNENLLIGSQAVFQRYTDVNTETWVKGSHFTPHNNRWCSVDPQNGYEKFAETLNELLSTGKTTLKKYDWEKGSVFKEQTGNECGDECYNPYEIVLK